MTDNSTVVGADSAPSTVAPTTSIYGLTLKGVPKLKPGRKPSTGPSATLKKIYLLNGVVLGVGRPSVDTLRARTFVVLPKNEAYDVAKHGTGTHDPADDVAADALAASKAETAARKLAARKTAPKATVVPAPAGPSIAEGAVSESITATPVAPAPAESTPAAETVTL